jgi:serine/threonine protein kinase
MNSRHRKLDLVRKMMTVEKNHRLTAEQALNHPWLNDQETVEIATKLMDKEKTKREQNRNTNSIYISKPESLIHESGCNSRKKRSVEISSSDIKKFQDSNAFIFSENKGSDGVVVQPSKKRKT